MHRRTPEQRKEYHRTNPPDMTTFAIYYIRSSNAGCIARKLGGVNRPGAWGRKVENAAETRNRLGDNREK